MSGPPCLPVLPGELLMEILSWLPVKTLLQFRCVSKFWNSLIFDPSFIKLHLQKSSRTIDILLQFDAYHHESDDDNELNEFREDLCLVPCSVHDLLENPSSTLVDCCQKLSHTLSLVVSVCNGLVCLLEKYSGHGYVEFNFQFWNPATRVMSRDSLSIRHNPFNLFRSYFGFGYDDLTDTYKMVALLSDDKSLDWEVKIHCFGDTSWRSISTFSTSTALISVGWRCYGTFLSGTINWLVLLGDQLLILSYDLKNQTHRYLSVPDNFGDVVHNNLHWCSAELAVLRGCLCLSRDHMKTNLVVWIMKESLVEKSWIQILNIRYERLTFRPQFLIPLYWSENWDIVMLDNHDDIELVIYNQRDFKIMKRIKDLNGTGFYSYDYSQSLVLPY